MSKVADMFKLSMLRNHSNRKRWFAPSSILGCCRHQPLLSRRLVGGQGPRRTSSTRTTSWRRHSLRRDSVCLWHQGFRQTRLRAYIGAWVLRLGAYIWQPSLGVGRMALCV
jgi:hypothetical protein